MIGEAHRARVAEAVRDGWRDDGLMRWVRTTARKHGPIEQWPENAERPLRTELLTVLLPALRGIYRLPDAWKVSLEGRAHGWGYRVLVIDWLEVADTHFLSPEKWDDLQWLCGLCDDSDHLALRVWEQAAEVGPRCLIMDSDLQMEVA